MSRFSLRAEIYRSFMRRVLKPIIVPRVFKEKASRERIFRELVSRGNPTEARSFPTGWFHAASVGELEMLTPVIEKWAALGTGLIVTIFSESAGAQLEKLAAKLRSSGARLLFAGYSPWEGEWQDVLAHVDPDFMMTARYEAWPELWMSLGDQGIPLVVIGARSRSSLKWAKRICRWSGERLPKILFCSVEESESLGLRSEFPEAEFITTGDPRWERVTQRAAEGSSRARELIERFRAFPRPWGVIGSAWEEDMKRWSSVFRAKILKGTLWVVPHRIDESFVRPIEETLKSSGLAPARVQAAKSDSSLGSSSAGPKCLLINEMGFLAELYSAVDWAYVGGGFSEGVHNTVEPAIHGIPVACGPKRADRFPEIAMLESTGQLHKTPDADSIARWLTTAQGPADEPAKARWKEYARSHLGASDAILKELRGRVSGWQLQQ